MSTKEKRRELAKKLAPLAIRIFALQALQGSTWEMVSMVGGLLNRTHDYDRLYTDLDLLTDEVKYEVLLEQVEEREAQAGHQSTRIQSGSNP